MQDLILSLHMSYFASRFKDNSFSKFAKAKQFVSREGSQNTTPQISQILLGEISQSMGE